MKRFLNRHDIIFIVLMILVFWSIADFFITRTAPLRSHMPKKLEHVLRETALPGEPVFLASALLDQLIWQYPDLQIYPGGGKSVQFSRNRDHFFLFTCDDIPDIISDRKDLEITAKHEAESCRLIRYVTSGLTHFTVRASAMLPSFTVTSSFRKNPVPFRNGEYRTGPDAWQRVYINGKTFDGTIREAISAHPVGNAGTQLSITIPSADVTAEKIYIAGGIADSGLFPGGKAVDVTVSQNEQSATFHFRGSWKQYKLPGFSGDAPIHVRIETENSGKRHFHFDIHYLVANRNGK